MERRSCLNPASSSPASGNDYEVFLSFRGPDTRQSFTDCLYHNMRGAGIHVFRDDDELRIGERIGGALLQALDNSKIYIPIFSKTCASSKWCLMELAKMLENTSKSEGKKVILPIFFDVEPNDVKLKTPLYNDALLEHEKKYSVDEVKAWREALVEVDEIKGWTLKNRGHGELIGLVIKEILIKLSIKYKKKLTEHFVEDHSQINAILELLDIESEGVRFVGLHGTGGIGKTTMAKVIFNKLYSQFDRCCFLENVREASRCKGIEYLQQQLLSTTLGFRFADKIYDIDDVTDMIEQRLCNKKVLIVLDDLDREEQLKKLAGKCCWFGFGSRIIVTTRETSILKIDVGISPHTREILCYEVREMGFNQALQLFCKHAFRRDSPLEGYDNLSKQIVSTLGMLPLAVEVIGSFLSDSFMDRDLWEETLEKIQKVPPKEVQDTLMISYDKLDLMQQQVFLDIACFFIGEDKTCPIFMWHDCHYYPLDAIKVLLLRSLIKIGEDNKFWMHDQVRDLARHIVYEEICKYPGKRSRVWIHKDALNILKTKEGNEDVEALSLCFGDYRPNDYTITDKEVANLRNLRLLRASRINFVGNFQNLFSNLRWLSWQGCPPNFKAVNFCPINLVVLDLSYSNITENWDGWKQIKMTGKLKVLDLTGCKFLKRTPNFSNFMSLEILILTWCSHLTTVDRSIIKLKQLKTLNMEHCKSLQELPEEIGSLKSLSRLILTGYHSDLSKLPETIGNLKALSSLTLTCPSVNRLPYSIGELVNLTNLSLLGCTEIKGLPETIGNLKVLLSLKITGLRINRLPYSIGGLVSLTKLSLRVCREIKELPDSIGELESLVELDLAVLGIVYLPNSIINLKRLKVLTVVYTPIRKLPEGIGMLEMLEVLNVNGCRDLSEEIPKEIGSLSPLRSLSLSDTHISILPRTISRLSCLQTLELGGCYKLQRLPELPSSLTFLCLPYYLRLEGDDIRCWLSGLARYTSTTAMHRLLERGLVCPEFFNSISH